MPLLACTGKERLPEALLRQVKPCSLLAQRTAPAEPEPLLEAGVPERADLRLEVVSPKDSALWHEYIDR
jgi:hypothetical protein